MKTRRAAAVVTVILLLPALVSAQRQTRKLFVTAIDQQGAPVPDLGPGDFTIREGGVTREIQRVRLSNEPLRVALVIDSSSESERALNEMRAALAAFINRLPAEHEIAFLTIGRQLRIRVPPTLARPRLLDAAKVFSADGGGTVLLDGAREINDRFLRNADDRWPVMVIVTTDGPETSGTTHDDDYLKFLQDLTSRQTTVHSFLLQAHGGGLTGEIAMNLAGNTGGQYSAMLTNNLLAGRMRELAERLENDHRRMSIAYEIDYASDGQSAGAEFEVGVVRSGVKLGVSIRRPIM